MKASIRHLAVVMLSAMALLVPWLTYQQTAATSTYADDPRNARANRLPIDDSLGNILTADGTLVAGDSADGIRVHPGGPAYTHVIGHTIEGLRSWGIESSRASELRSRDDGSISAWLTDLLGGDIGPPDIRLTIDDLVQRTAFEALGPQRGAVVAIDPRTGEVLAYVSTPSFDVDLVASGELDNEVVESDPSNPLLDRAAASVYPPGSTFKVVVAAAAMAELGFTPASLLDDSAAFEVGGSVIRNAGGGACGDGNSITLSSALTTSCNTAFAQLAISMGSTALRVAASQFGFESSLPWELGAGIPTLSSDGAIDIDPAALAQTAIGERDVRTTALHLALVASAIANRGIAMQPYIVAERTDRSGDLLDMTEPQEFLVALTPQASAQLTEMMIRVVSEGTGRAAGLGDVEVAGKTGTAEGGGGPHAWFIGFAPASAPTVAVAVIVEGGGILGDAGTGGSVAAPIAARVMEAALRIGS